MSTDYTDPVNPNSSQGAGYGTPVTVTGSTVNPNATQGAGRGTPIKPLQDAKTTSKTTVGSPSELHRTQRDVAWHKGRRGAGVVPEYQPRPGQWQAFGPLSQIEFTGGFLFNQNILGGSTNYSAPGIFSLGDGDWIFMTGTISSSDIDLSVTDGSSLPDIVTFDGDGIQTEFCFPLAVVDSGKIYNVNGGGALSLQYTNISGRLVLYLFPGGGTAP